LGSASGSERVIRVYRNGRDLTASPRDAMVIDAYGLSAAELMAAYPAIYQHVFTTVKPERDQNKRETYRKNWWIHGEPRSEFRPALAGLPRFVATVETSKHRFFVFLDYSILPDNKLINFALSDAFYLGVMSSAVHVNWALACGSRLGFGNDPSTSRPAASRPSLSPTCRSRIR